MPIEVREPVNEDQAPPVVPGQVIGERYCVGQLIGKGGMGFVCEATHVGLEVPVAIKFIRPDLKDDSEYVQRFLNEARRAAALKSEHVARVHDVGQLESGDLYLVMERLEGLGLEAHIRERGPLPQADAVDLVLQACEGLSEAHAAGIVHRDIKPENLFLARRSDGRCTLKILDFGISKQTADDAPSSLTNRDRSLGSPWYMSPEQMLDTSKVDHRADIWSLGVVLFELLTNARPFEGGTVPEVCGGVLTAATPSLRERRPEIDPALEAIVFRCLAKNPDERYASVLSLGADLKPFSSLLEPAPKSLDPAAEETFFKAQTEVGDRTTPISLAPLSRRTLRRVTLARTMGVVGILASLALGIWAFSVGNVEPSWERELEPGAPALDPGKAPAPAPASAGTAIPEREVEARPLGSGSPIDGHGRASDATPEPNAQSPRAAQDPRPGQDPRAAPAPAFTPEEIRRRKERYEQWLRDQGLKRLDEVVVPVPSDTPADRSGEQSTDLP